MFISRLESLRGLAALMVAVGHCFVMLEVDGLADIRQIPFAELPGWRSWVSRVMLIVFNGPAAVTVFFVLSGTVLGMSLERRAQTVRTTASFFCRRLLRILPAHLFCLLVIVFYVGLIHTHRAYVPASAVFIQLYESGLTGLQLFRNALLLENDLNPVSWTLTIELGISIAIPLMFFIIRSQSAVRNSCVLMLLVAASWLLPNNQIGRYAYVFFLGLMLTRIHAATVARLSTTTWNGLLVLSIIFLCLARTLFAKEYAHCFVLLEALMASVVVVYLVYVVNPHRFLRVLDHPWLQLLGKVSFSFYLWHFVVLYWCATLLFKCIYEDVARQYPLSLALGLMVISVFLAYQVATISYRLVEVPFITVGKRVTAWIVRPEEPHK